MKRGGIVRGKWRIINISNRILFKGLSKLIERAKDKNKPTPISKTILIYPHSKISNKSNNIFTKIILINKKSLSMLMDLDS